MKLLAGLTLCALAVSPLGAEAQRIVVLHTNDTHSQIDPVAETDLGGVARRKALIDSVRRAEPNVVLLDAGDAVQGSVFYTLFKGEVEQRLMDSLRYDIQIVGNHEFDNGMEALARQYATTPATLISTNYDFSATPLDGRFVTYKIMPFGDKKIAFIAGNLNPAGMIDEDNYKGLTWTETDDALNAAAWWLKNVEKVDKVIAVTHIGYSDDSGTDDLELIRSSKDIDAVIGGHSHTLVDPSLPSNHAVNAAGVTIPVSQTKNRGQYVGELIIDFDGLNPKGSIYGKLLPVDSRYDALVDGSVEAIVAPYREKVDEISSEVLATSPHDWDQNSPDLLNLLSDFMLVRGEELAGAPVDLALLNKGGIRTGIKQGPVTSGQIMAMLPFNNNVQVLEISGRDLLDTFAINAGQEGQGVNKGVEVIWDPSTLVVEQATINGKPIDPKRTYRLATLSYLARGGDYMTPLTKGKVIASSKNIIFEDIINYLRANKIDLNSHDATLRMHPAK